MATDNNNKILNFSSKREQNEIHSDFAEREKNQGKNFLNVPNKREQSETCFDSAERGVLRPKGNVPNKGNVPKLRFPEFTSSWKKVRLKDECSFFSGGTPASTVKEYYDGDIPFIRSGEINSDITELYISEEGLNNSSAKYVEQGDLLLALYGATSGMIGISKIKGAINQAILCIRTSNNKVFLKSVWEKHVKQILQAYLQGGQGNLSADIVKKLQFNIPTKEEQEKICNFITLIDQRIATQNKIIEDLKKLKVAICNKYLIKGYSMRLGDIGYFVRGLSYSASDVVESNGTAVIRSNNIINGDLLNFNDLVYVDKKSTKEQQLKSSDIVICMANGSSALVGKASYYNGSFDENITIGAFCGIYRSSNPIVRWLFQSSHYRKCILKNIQGGNGAIANVYPEDILNISFQVTTDLHNISNLLQQIEDKITNEYCLLNNYSQTKLYLLNNMFI